MIMLYTYYIDWLIFQMRYPPRIMLRYIGLLWFGLTDMIYLEERISKMTSKMVDYSSWDSPYVLDEQRGVGHSSDLENMLKILKEEIRICKADNDIIIQAQEKQAEVKAMIFQSLSDL